MRTFAHNSLNRVFGFGVDIGENDALPKNMTDVLYNMRSGLLTQPDVATIEPWVAAGMSYEEWQDRKQQIENAAQAGELPPECDVYTRGLRLMDRSEIPIRCGGTLVENTGSTDETSLNGAPASGKPASKAPLLAAAAGAAYFLLA